MRELALAWFTLNILFTLSDEILMGGSSLERHATKELCTALKSVALQTLILSPQGKLAVPQSRDDSEQGRDLQILHH